MLKVHILWRMNKSSINAYSLVKEFSSDSLASSFFRDRHELRDYVYNAIKSLEKDGLLVSSQRIENGRLKQYYKLTKEGEIVLRSSVKEFLKGSEGVSALFSGKENVVT